MSEINTRDPVLWERAQNTHPRAMCSCGRLVWQHWTGTYEDAVLKRWCSPLFIDAAEVIEEYETLLAKRITGILTSTDKTDLSQLPKYTFGFTGFTNLRFKSAKIINSRYAPGTMTESDVGSGRIYAPGTGLTELADLSWGAQLDQLREFVQPRILLPLPPKTALPCETYYQTATSVVIPHVYPSTGTAVQETMSELIDRALVGKLAVDTIRTMPSTLTLPDSLSASDQLARSILRRTSLQRRSRLDTVPVTSSAISPVLPGHSTSTIQPSTYPGSTQPGQYYKPQSF